MTSISTRFCSGPPDKKARSRRENGKSGENAASLAGLAEKTGAQAVEVLEVVKAVDLPRLFLDTGGLPAGNAKRTALPVAGDEARAKRIVIELLDELGFDGVDGGSLEESWRQQPGTLVYCTNLDAAQTRQVLASADQRLSSELRELGLFRAWLLFLFAQTFHLPANDRSRPAVEHLTSLV